MKTLILTMGFPNTGKTTWSRSTGYPVVSMDAVRFTMTRSLHPLQSDGFVRELAKLMVKSLFSNHDTVIVDHCHFRRRQRDFWISDKWSRQLKMFGGPERRELYLDRLRSQFRPAVANTKLKRWLELWEPVQDEEGFEHV